MVIRFVVKTDKVFVKDEKCVKNKVKSMEYHRDKTKNNTKGPKDQKSRRETVMLHKFKPEVIGKRHIIACKNIVLHNKSIIIGH